MLLLVQIELGCLKFVVKYNQMECNCKRTSCFGNNWTAGFLTAFILNFLTFLLFLLEIVDIFEINKAHYSYQNGKFKSLCMSIQHLI